MIDCFSPDSKLLAAPDSSLINARVWQADGQQIAVLTGHTDAINSVRFSPDGSQLVTASNDGTARLWRADGTLIRALSVNTATLSSAMFSADGQRIITFHADGLTRIWSSTGTLLAELPGFSAPFAVNAQAQIVLTADNAQVIHLWRDDGTPVSAFTSTMPSSLSALAFSRDGRTLLLGGSDGTVQLWDTAHGRLIGTLTGHTDQVWSASFNADGTRVATASRDGTTRLWPVFGTVDAMTAEAQRRVGRSLYDDECLTWLGKPCSTVP